MEEKEINEQFIVDRIIDFMINSTNPKLREKIYN